MTSLDQIDKTRVPQHVAIIMDGNGRWAMKQQQERLFGHHNGLTAVRQAVEAAVEMGVKYLTLYTFSTENWNRPQAEVDGLMELLITAVEENTDMLMENGVRLETIGDFGRIPERSRNRFRQCMDRTAVNNKLTLIIALSYSSRWEIAEALKQICNEGLKADEVDEETRAKAVELPGGAELADAKHRRKDRKRYLFNAVTAFVVSLWFVEVDGEIVRSPPHV